MNARAEWSFAPAREVGPKPPRIGIAVLAHERPEYLELCLDSLFRTRLGDYEVTFLIQDDGSKDPRVRELIEKPRGAQYRIVRSYQTKGPNSWGAAFNRAMRELRSLGEFDILGSCDADALFHPDWLVASIPLFLEAKRSERDFLLGPFSCFNSSDSEFHQVLARRSTSRGRYWVKRRMGALVYLYFREDLERLGEFTEDRDDETRMTERFDRLRVRNFCSETSWVEHIGDQSILNQWRETPVRDAVHALCPAQEGWPEEYQRYLVERGSP